MNPRSPTAANAVPPPGAALRALRPTRVRWRIVALMAVIAGLTYLDRINLSIAAKPIQAEFNFSTATMGWVLSAFVLGYALCQAPAGWLGDRFGPRAVLTVAIAWWSVFTAATELAPGLPVVRWLNVAWSFALVRFLIGVGESATFPNLNKMVAAWMGSERRAVGNSLPFVGIGIGGVLTPVFIAHTMERWGWRVPFYICGAVGLLVAIAWRCWARDHPADHPGVNPAELELIGRDNGRRTAPRDAGRKTHLPLRVLAGNRSVWALSLSAMGVGYSAYIFYTWFFIYLVRFRGLSVAEASWGATAPFVAITALAPLGGWFSDWAVRKLGRRPGRRAAIWVGMGLSGTFLALGSHAASTPAAIALLALAAGLNLFATATLWAVCIDLAPSSSGSLSGCMNTCGSLGGWISPILTGWIAARFGWPQALDVAALASGAAAALWLFVDADASLEGKTD